MLMQPFVASTGFEPIKFSAEFGIRTRITEIKSFVHDHYANSAIRIYILK